MKMTVVLSNGDVAEVPIPLNAHSVLGGAYDNVRKIKSEEFIYPTPEKCIKAVADYSGIPDEHLRSKTNMHKISHARQMAYTLIRETCGASYPVIAGEFKKDHTTVIHGIRSFLSRIEKDDALRVDYARILAQFLRKPAELPPPKIERKKPVANVKKEVEPAQKEKPKQRKCSCGRHFTTTEDYRFCGSCRDRMARNSSSIGI